jgi:hypothetical protein
MLTEENDQWKMQAVNNIAKTNQDVAALHQRTIENEANLNDKLNECQELKQVKAD